MLCYGERVKDARKPYFLFSKTMKEPYSCYRNPCDKLDLKHKEHFPNNYFFPPEKYKDNLLKYKHVARDEVTVEPFIREFIINEDFEIIDFKTLNKNDKFYFYYD